MRLLVLSRSQTIPSTRLLVRAGEARGHQVTVVSPSKHALEFAPRPGPRPDPFQVIIPRLPRSAGEHALLAVEQYHGAGAMCLNAVHALQLTRLAPRWIQRLFSSEIPVPRTVMIRDVRQMKAALSAIDSVPMQVVAIGPEPQADPVVCDSEQSLEAVLEAVLGLGHSVMMQEHVKRSAHAFVLTVVDGLVTSTRVLAGAPHETEAAAALAVAAAEACELDVCAVEVSQGRAGLMVTGVNACPALDEASARAVIECAEARVAAVPPLK